MADHRHHPLTARGHSAGGQHPRAADEVGDHRQAQPLAQVGEDERPLTAHPPRVPLHDLQRRAHVRGQVDLVDHQQVRAGDPGAALARDFLPLRHVDDVNRQVGQFRAEGGGQVVPAALDEDDVQIREALAASPPPPPGSWMASSRMAVWGQPPVSTPTIRPRAGPGERIRNSASSRV